VGVDIAVVIAEEENGGQPKKPWVAEKNKCQSQILNPRFQILPKWTFKRLQKYTQEQTRCKLLYYFRITTYYLQWRLLGSLLVQIT
jgi:hypothetical protein